MTRHIAIAVKASPTASEIRGLRIDLREIESPGPSQGSDGYQVRLHPVIMNSPLIEIERNAGWLGVSQASPPGPAHISPEIGNVWRAAGTREAARETETNVTK
jgi:hypothetical protein